MKKQGISLIVLVITIIVMIILAAAIIISLNNTGIISNSNKAVEETNDKTVVELANLAWGEAYANGERNVTKLKDAVETALTNNNLDKDDYGINVTDKGVDLVKGWLQTSDKKVVKGSQVLEIGDTVDYDETKGGEVKVAKDVEWAVLGAENGSLLIVSNANVEEDAKKIDLNLVATLETRKAAYQNAIDTLNNICKPYGFGNYAVSARSLKAEDIDKITGFNKYESELGSLKYGESITYYWDTDSSKYGESNNYKYSYPYYETEIGLTGNDIGAVEFVWYDGDTFKTSVSPMTPPSEKTKICTLTQTNYTYKMKDVLDETGKIYKLLCSSSYFLANKGVNGLDTACFGLLGVGINNSNYILGYTPIVFCNTLYKENKGKGVHGVRAVVTLRDDVKLQNISSGNWKLTY